MPESHEWQVYRRGATGLHIDSSDKYPPSTKFPLTLNFICRGAVEITFVPIRKSELPIGLSFGVPERLDDELVDNPGVECSVDVLEDRFLPKDIAAKVGKIITVHAGQLVAFSGFEDTTQDRLPVAHQFISLGDTPEERNNRLSSFIKTDLLLHS
jgi:hypothetical protein